MSTACSGSFQRERKMLVVVLVLAVMCGSVRGSRFVKPTAYEDHHKERSPPPPPPLRWWQHPPPPPLIIQWPPPIHHWYRRYPPSPPPPSIPPPSPSPPPPVNLNASYPPSPPLSLLSSPPPPPSRSQQSPPPPTSSPPPPPPLDGGRSKLWDGKHSQNGRRLLSNEDGASFGRNHFLVTDASPGKCSDEPAMSPSSYGAPPLVPYGGYIVPVGAPYPSSGPGALSPVPAPTPTSGADGPTPESGDNGTMVSAMMQVGLVGSVIQDVAGDELYLIPVVLKPKVYGVSL